MRRVFTIDDKFSIKDRGVVLSGAPFAETENHRLAEGATVFIVSDGKEILKAPMLGFELGRNCFSPHLPRGMSVLVGWQFAECVFPEKAEIWVEEASLLPPQTEKNSPVPGALGGRDFPIKVGTKSLTSAFERGLPITFSAQSQEQDWFACRADWKDGGKAYYAIGKRFQASSDRKANHLAEQILRSQLAGWAKKTAH